MRSFVLGCTFLTFTPIMAFSTSPPIMGGSVEVKLTANENSIPDRYRLDPSSFDYTIKWMYNIPGYSIGVYDLRFPSAVESDCPENNTVYAEYYRPEGKGPFPCVIVLDVTGGDQSLSRVICTHLARHGVGGLFVQMAYYGPRRPAGSGLRLLSTDYAHTASAIRQTILDMRRATAWMESRPEIDAKRLGILGTSLGSFMAALTGEMEPKLGRVALLLGGGGLIDGYYDDPRAAGYRKIYEALGGSREKLAKMIAPLDPITCAATLKNRKLLMLAGRHDEIVPPKMAENLWRASGEQQIIWYNCGHYTAVIYFADALEHIVQHFDAE